MNTVFVEKLPISPYNKCEILRYCGVKKSDSQTEELLAECLKIADGKFQNTVCFSEFDIVKGENTIDLGFTKIKSQLLLRHLKDCQKIVLFAATIGLEIDRLVTKYSRISPSKAVMLQAIGAERIEALCDAFENKIKAECRLKSLKTVTRVSAGYGDIPLSLQRDIFTILDCPRKIGLTLNESMLMSPTKSVTAIIGIGEI